MSATPVSNVTFKKDSYDHNKNIPITVTENKAIGTVIYVTESKEVFICNKEGDGEELKYTITKTPFTINTDNLNTKTYYLVIDNEPCKNENIKTFFSCIPPAPPLPPLTKNEISSTSDANKNPVAERNNITDPENLGRSEENKGSSNEKKPVVSVESVEKKNESSGLVKIEMPDFYKKNITVYDITAQPDTLGKVTGTANCNLEDIYNKHIAAQANVINQIISRGGDKANITSLISTIRTKINKFYNHIFSDTDMVNLLTNYINDTTPMPTEYTQEQRAQELATLDDIFKNVYQYLGNNVINNTELVQFFRMVRDDKQSRNIPADDKLYLVKETLLLNNTGIVRLYNIFNHPKENRYKVLYILLVIINNAFILLAKKNSPGLEVTKHFLTLKNISNIYYYDNNYYLYSIDKSIIQDLTLTTKKIDPLKQIDVYKLAEQTFTGGGKKTKKRLTKLTKQRRKTKRQIRK